MADILTPRQAVARCKENNIPVTEYALRLWIRQGKIPVRKVGQKQLLSFSTLVDFVRCADGCGDNLPGAMS